MFLTKADAKLAKAAQTHENIKQHFLLTGTPAQWQQVTHNPALFNQAWRKMLNLPAGDMPPLSV